MREENCTFPHPYIVTMGGTDIHVDLTQNSCDKETYRFLEKASFVTLFNPEAKMILQGIQDEWESKLRIIPQGLLLPDQVKSQNNDLTRRDNQLLNNGTLESIGQSKKDSFIILLPAGLRRIKDVLHLLNAWIALHQQIPNLKVVLIGEALENEVLEQVLEASKSHPFLEYRGPIPFHEMPNIYEQSDLVINTSLEEGQPTAICEAMMLGIPVIARDNAGNRSVIRHGINGFIYQEPQDFIALVEKMRGNPMLTKELAMNGQKYIKEERTIEKEIASYLELFQKME
jgi:glycosyltransferase involved in cell wall biosynthesis